MRPINAHAFTVPSASRVAGARERDRIASAHGRARDEMHGAGGKLEMRGAMIGGEFDREPALAEHDRQRLGRKQVPAGAAGAEEDGFVHVDCGHDFSASCPALCRAPTSHFGSRSKTWMAGTTRP